MSALGHLRRSRRLNRSVFTLFALACLQILMTPCVMAGEFKAHAMAGQYGAVASDSMHSQMKDCIYCPPHSSDRSDSAMHGCAYPHDVQTTDSTHSVQHELFDHVVWLHNSPLTVTIPFDHENAPTRYLAVPISHRRLNLTYGVQLK